ncbi:transcriptional regulator, AraC family [Rhizobium sp. RU20A]|uniref:helix-turn-helix transcriptional regulator n=1 Tax=Rhizobium sp. RU20A TaxID=1907412 RepID=UPI00095715EC|nr:AraC family transcriptional regulator [Rhizobium sp. RU20A]SIQ13602.1 transcriptional regulator, AraC family [Rhizobium sp. RU20A]
MDMHPTGTASIEDHEPAATEAPTGVSLFSITQATAATFTDLFIGLTFLCFITSGTKRVLCPVHGEIIGEEGDLLVFPTGSIVTLENGPIPKVGYRAEGVYFPRDLVQEVFSEHTPRHSSAGIQILRAACRPHEMLNLLRETVERPDLPPLVRRHRLLEPLLCLRHHGIQLPAQDQDQPSSAVRRLIESDVARRWRVGEVARHFAMSEATFRRWLTKSGPGFHRVLMNTRLEKGLARLQSTTRPISEIALDCGFKTPSHFSDAFRERFGIKPRSIRSAED